MKPKRALTVGETDGEFIGCYLFGIEATSHDDASYHSLATTKGELIADCKSFFAQLMEMKKKKMMSPRPMLRELGDLANLMSDALNKRHEEDLASIEFILKNMDRYVDAYLASDMKKPFWETSGMTLFLRTGAIKRE